MSFPFQPKQTAKQAVHYAREALREDRVRFDVTTRALSLRNQQVKGVIIANERGTLCGLPFCKATFHLAAKEIRGAKGLGIIRFRAQKKEGENFTAGEKIAEVQGQAAPLLAAERTALNFLQRLSAIATRARLLASKIAPPTRLLDTRKNTPLFRYPEKYAAWVGGAANHRFTLQDAMLIKDNHKALYPTLSTLLQDLYRHSPSVPVEVEIESFEELKEALAFPIQGVLLDNMPLPAMRRCLPLCRKHKVWVEVSGGITEAKLSSLKRLSVDYISASSMVLQAGTLDFSFELLAPSPKKPQKS